MLEHPDDTIFAPATGSAPAAIAVLRLSGSEAIAIADKVFSARVHLAAAVSHSAHYGYIRDHAGKTVDDVLATVFRGPRSYTGEDTVEFSCHGSPAIVRRIGALVLAAGARMAEPGEFTKRAFLNGRLDLAQAEAVADLVRASDERSLELARRQFDGELTAVVGTVRKKIVELSALLALGLDFSEDDTGIVSTAAAREALAAARQTLDQLVGSYRSGRLVHDGIGIVIAGPPNAGKSSLLNRLLREPRAIVSEMPGTTRDIVHGDIVVEGFHFRIHDTAGVRDDAADSVERIGIDLALDAVRSADIVLLVDDATAPPLSFCQQLARVAGAETSARVIHVLNKTDLSPAGTTRGDALPVSALDGRGIDALLDRIVQCATGMTAVENSAAVLTKIRQRDACAQARELLDQAGRALDDGEEALAASDLDRATAVLGCLIGEVTTDDILAAVFSEFCIGK